MGATKRKSDVEEGVARMKEQRGKWKKTDHLDFIFTWKVNFFIMGDEKSFFESIQGGSSIKKKMPIWLLKVKDLKKAITFRSVSKWSIFYRGKLIGPWLAGKKVDGRLRFVHLCPTSSCDSHQALHLNTCSYRETTNFRAPRRQSRPRRRKLRQLRK